MSEDKMNKIKAGTGINKIKVTINELNTYSTLSDSTVEGGIFKFYNQNELIAYNSAAGLKPELIAYLDSLLTPKAPDISTPIIDNSGDLKGQYDDKELDISDNATKDDILDLEKRLHVYVDGKSAESKKQHDDINTEVKKNQGTISTVKKNTEEIYALNDSIDKKVDSLSQQVTNVETGLKQDMQKIYNAEGATQKQIQDFTTANTKEHDDLDKKYYPKITQLNQDISQIKQDVSQILNILQNQQTPNPRITQATTGPVKVTNPATGTLVDLLVYNAATNSSTTANIDPSNKLVSNLANVCYTEIPVAPIVKRGKIIIDFYMYNEKYNIEIKTNGDITKWLTTYKKKFNVPRFLRQMGISFTKALIDEKRLLPEDYNQNKTMYTLYKSLRDNNFSIQDAFQAVRTKIVPTQNGNKKREVEVLTGNNILDFNAEDIMLPESLATDNRFTNKSDLTGVTDALSIWESMFSLTSPIKRNVKRPTKADKEIKHRTTYFKYVLSLCETLYQTENKVNANYRQGKSKIDFTATTWDENQQINLTA
ncbi:Uncharacterised protein [Candidatus Tiddalikarchaeum anstoanum]|nr:Uncharacterised protein [Candidatus Tiddalikarchaeum anstoanum]